MRKIIVLTFVTLDGVMQAPGGPEEDTSDDFKFGGWTVTYFDEYLGKEMEKQMSTPFDLLLGRKTFEIFAAHWPNHPEEGKEINEATKYVASHTLQEHTWQNTVFLNPENLGEEIKKLKEEDGPNLQVHGSSNFIQTLLSMDLIDEYWLKIFPISIGKGKHLFGSGTIPKKFILIEASHSPSGVIIAKYKSNGDIETGSF